MFAETSDKINQATLLKSEKNIDVKAYHSGCSLFRDKFYVRSEIMCCGPQ